MLAFSAGLDDPMAAEAWSAMVNDTVDVVAGGIRTAPVTDSAKLRLANHFAHLLAETDGFDRQRFLKACSPIGTDFSKGGARDGRARPDQNGPEGFGTTGSLRSAASLQ